MSRVNGILNSITGTSTLVRPKFGPGMLLQHDDLERMITYTRELNRLMFRSLFGCGVVCGLTVEPESTKCGVYITVKAGLALNCLGDPVFVPKDQRLALDKECDPDIPNRLWVILCSTTKCCAPRPPICSSEDDESSPVCTQERDGFEIRIVSRLPECICGQPENEDPSCVEDCDCRCVDPTLPAYVDHYAGKCGCSCEEGVECCCCDCILLARLDENDGQWKPNYRVRRFVRPVLICDPTEHEEEEEPLTGGGDPAGGGGLSTFSKTPVEKTVTKSKQRSRRK